MATTGHTGDRFNILASNGSSILGSHGSTWAKLDLDLPNNLDFKKLSDRIDEIEKRLCILHENKTLQEKYESLREAYEAYKIIEKLVYEQDKNETGK